MYFKFDYFRQQLSNRFIESSKAEDSLQEIMKLRYSRKDDNYFFKINYLKKTSKVTISVQRQYLKYILLLEISTIIDFIPESTNNQSFVE